MKKIPLLLGGVVILCGLLVVASVFRPSLLRLTQADFDRLTIGMTPGEVELLLGGPPRNQLKARGTVFVPQLTGLPRTAFISPGAVSTDFFPQTKTKDGYQAVWISRKSLIAVYFGHDGRLQSKHFSIVDEARPPSIFFH